MSNPILQTPARQHGRIDWLTVGGLDAKARLVCQYLDRAPRKCREAWWSAERIARDLGEGFSLSTVRNIIRKLELMGLIETVRDYALKTRRRLVLLWRPEPEPAAVEPAAVATPAPHPLPDAERTHRDDLRRVRRPSPEPAAAPAVAEAPAEPPRGGDATPAAGRKATPEEVRELTDAAERAGGTAGDAVRLARRHRLSTVLAAARRAAEKGKGWGWVVKVSAAWAREGVPDYAAGPTPTPKPRSGLEEWGVGTLEEEAAAIDRLFGPNGTVFKGPSVLEEVLKRRDHERAVAG